MTKSARTFIEYLEDAQDNLREANGIAYAVNALGRERWTEDEIAQINSLLIELNKMFASTDKEVGEIQKYESKVKVESVK